ncbi:Anosmin-1 [Taenia crassiceps]|uniref:Anosmin-1 n=1 Tax=Taenia crassiceps TaxID=6207 RepID=A0ABR4QND6_9CEST
MIKGRYVQQHSLSNTNTSLVLLPTDFLHTTMVSPHGILPVILTILALLTAGTADITDMIGEAICAAQCLTNFTLSLDEPERSFLSQRPDLTEPHCLSKRSNCSLCLEVCRWPQQNISSCESSCKQLEASALQMLPNSPLEIHRRTCLEACAFLHTNRRDRAAVVSGQLPASCPLPTSWPDGSTCQPHQSCTTDADCGHGSLAKCCRFDACLLEHQSPPPSPSMLYRLARGGGPSTLHRPLPPTGFCMRITNDTAFAYRGVAPVPGRPSVRQTAMTLGEQDVYKLELDWPDYYNLSRPASSPDWIHPAVFLVQVRLFRDLGDQVFGDQSEFGDEIFQEELFSEWRSLVWTTKVGAVLSDLSPGTWYQFRLKAASGAGFGGNGRPSRPIKLMTLPEAPRNLTESNLRIHSNKVEVKLQWEPPAYGSAPVKFYRISWKKYAPMDMDDNSLGEYGAKVPKKVLTYTLQDLEPGTSYKVQVTSVAVVDGKEWSSSPVTRFIKTVPVPSKEYPISVINYYYHTEAGRCRCGDSPENRNFIQPAFFEGGVLKVHLTIPRHLLAQYFGSSVKDTTIFQLLWSPHVCIETPNSEVGFTNTPTVIKVYAANLSDVNLENLQFQCHYKLQIRMTEVSPKIESKNSLDLCFCTPSCTEVVVRSGPGPRNCSFADVLVPHRPVDVGYRLFPTEANQRHPIASGVAAISSQSETEPIFPVRNAFKTSASKSLGFDAIIFWKPHPDMVMATEGIGRSTKYINPKVHPFSEARRQLRGYRVIWGPRLVEPIEPDMYSNGIAPQLDPERTESKVVDSKVHNVILRNLEPDTLYIVQVQTIGAHGDSPVNAVFFTTPSLGVYDDADSSSVQRCSLDACMPLASLCLILHCVLLR